MSKKQRDKYKLLKSTEMAQTMKACYEDAVRLRDFNPLTDPDLAYLKGVMEARKINAVAAALVIIEHTAGSNDKKTAQATFRNVLAAAFYLMVVNPAPNGKDSNPTAQA